MESEHDLEQNNILETSMDLFDDDTDSDSKENADAQVGENTTVTLVKDRDKYSQNITKCDDYINDEVLCIGQANKESEGTSPVQLKKTQIKSSSADEDAASTDNLTQQKAKMIGQEQSRASEFIQSGTLTNISDESEMPIGHRLLASSTESTHMGSSFQSLCGVGKMTDVTNQREMNFSRDNELSDDSHFFTCPFCNIREVSLHSLEFHVAIMHPDTSETSSQATPTSNSNVLETTHSLSSCSMPEASCLFTCPVCDLPFCDEISLHVHLNTAHTELNEHEGQLSCPLCDVVCSSDNEMKRHTKTHSDDETYFGISHYEDDATGLSQVQSESTSKMMCPICGIVENDAALITSHVESHFNPQHSQETGRNSSFRKEFNNKENEPSLSMDIVRTRDKKKIVSAPQNCQEKNGYKQQYEKNLERAVARGDISPADFYEERSIVAQKDFRGVDNGRTRIQGLIEKLRHHFQTQARPGQTIHLCSPTDHFSGSFGDRGWGCGYRNFQMLLSCLMQFPEYRHKICPDGHMEIPSVPKLQEMIEAAWSKGFDPQGCGQLGGRLLGTRKWIGATEIVATLSYMGIKCQLADFPAPSAPDGSHPRLLQWVSDKFLGNDQPKPPLYLQHQGHSRTIVGVEKDKGTTKLIIFDPGTHTDIMASIAENPLTWKQMRTFRRTQNGLRAKQYQVVAVLGVLSGPEYQESKSLKSVRIV